MPRRGLAGTAEPRGSRPKGTCFSPFISPQSPFFRAIPPSLSPSEDWGHGGKVSGALGAIEVLPFARGAREGSWNPNTLSGSEALFFSFLRKDTATPASVVLICFVFTSKHRSRWPHLVWRHFAQEQQKDRKPSYLLSPAGRSGHSETRGSRRLSTIPHPNKRI